MIKNKILVYRTVDLENGLRTDSTSKETRTALFRRWQLPVEYTGKYKSGLDVFFEKEIISISLGVKNWILIL